MKKTLLICSLFLLSFASCKKEKATPEVKPDMNCGVITAVYRDIDASKLIVDYYYNLTVKFPDNSIIKVQKLEHFIPTREQGYSYNVGDKYCK